MKTLMKLLWATVIALPALTGCGPAIHGNGTVISEERSVTGFAGIRIAGEADLVLEQTESEYVTVETDENLIDYITTRWEDGVLVIGTRPNVILAPTHLVVYAGTPDIERIEIDGSGDVSATGGLGGDRLRIDIDGSGDVSGDIDYAALVTDIDGSGNVKLSGRADSHTIHIDGSGDIEASNLTTSITTVRIDGSGDVTVTALTSLDVSIEGSGDVQYYGTPSVRKSVSGSGSVTRR